MLTVESRLAEGGGSSEAGLLLRGASRGSFSLTGGDFSLGAGAGCGAVGWLLLLLLPGAGPALLAGSAALEMAA